MFLLYLYKLANFIWNQHRYRELILCFMLESSEPLLSWQCKLVDHLNTLLFFRASMVYEVAVKGRKHNKVTRQ